MERDHYKELIQRDAEKRAAKKRRSARDIALETIPGRQGSDLEAVFRVGDVIKLGTKEYLVWLVNACRAACLPTSGEGDSVDISPSSETEILRRLGKEGAIRLLEQSRETKTMSKEASRRDKEDTEEKDETPKMGKLGGFLGYPVTAVIRCMGKLGWEYWECRKVFDDNEIEVADNTIRIQLGHGRNGDGTPAPVEKKLKGMRPDKSEKPERAAPGTAKNRGKSKQELVEEEEETQARRAKGRKAAEEDEDEDEGEEEEEAPKKSKKGKKHANADEDEAPAKKGKKSKKADDEDEDEFPEAEEAEEEEEGEEAEEADE